MVMDANQCSTFGTLLSAFKTARHAWETVVDQVAAAETAMDNAETALDIAVANQAQSGTLIALAVEALQTFMDSVSLVDPLPSEDIDEAYTLGQVVSTLMQQQNDGGNTINVLGAAFAFAQNAYFAANALVAPNHAAYVAAWAAFKGFVDANISG